MIARRVPSPDALRLPSRTHAEPGQVLIIFALATFVLVGFIALSVDAGFLMAERRQTQNAADAAALAAAQSLYRAKKGEIQDAATAYGQLNAGLSAVVDASNPPLTGDYSTVVDKDDYVQVTITKDVDKYFVGALYTGNWSVSASAVAGVEKEPGNYALVTLDKNSSPGIYMNGNTTIVVTGNQASVYASTAVNGNGNLDVTGSIDSYGSVSGAGNAPNGVNEEMPYIPDPMAGVPKPSIPGGPSKNGCSGNCSLQPGYYDNQVIHCKDICTFAPGFYYFDDTSVTAQNTKSEMNGTGVMFFFTGSSYFDSKNGEVNLQAPATTPYTGGKDGVVFWMDTCQSLIDFAGNGDFYIKGIFYAPCSEVHMHGNPGGEAYYGQIIVGTFDVRGTSDFALTYNEYIETERPKVFLVN